MRVGSLFFAATATTTTTTTWTLASSVPFGLSSFITIPNPIKSRIAMIPAPSSQQQQQPPSRKENIGSLSSGSGELTPLIQSDGKKKQGENGQQSNKDVERGILSTKEKSKDEDDKPSWKNIMKNVSPVLRPADTFHTLLALTALTTVMISKVINVLPPLAIKYAIDTITKGTSETLSPKQLLQRVILAISCYFGLKAFSLALSSVQDVTQRTVSLDSERRFGNIVFRHMHHLGLPYHIERHVGEVIRVMNRGIDSISTLINSFIFFIFPTIVEAVLVSAVFWKLGTPWVALSTVCSMVLYLAFTVFITKTRIRYRRNLIEANDAVSRKETETLVNYETVLVFGRTDDEIEEYSELRKTYNDRRVEMVKMFALLEGGQKLIRMLGVACGLILAAYGTVYGNPKISAGSFVVIQIYIDQLYQPLTFLGFQYRMVTQAFTDLEKVVQVLMSVPQVQDAPDATDWKPSKPSLLNYGNHQGHAGGDIVFENVTFLYKNSTKKTDLGASNATQTRGRGRFSAPGGNETQPQTTKGRRGLFGSFGRNKVSDSSAPSPSSSSSSNGVQNNKNDDNNNKPSTTKTAPPGGVKNISFRIPHGQTIALVGRSGSGKTTTLRLLLRLYDPDTGSISIDTRDLRSLTQKSLRSNMGIVPQDTILFNAPLRDNIRYGKSDATEEEIWDVIRASSLEEFVNALPDGLDTIVGERGLKLSGGERQRVGLARCLIRRPKIILLDEATSSLDSGTERDIQRHLNLLRREDQGETTVFMIAHRLSTARNADLILVFEKGEICERGTHDQLLDLEGGRYAQMWKDQTEQHDDDVEQTSGDLIH